MTSKSATLNAVNDFVGAYNATPTVHVGAPVHPLSTYFGTTIHATPGNPYRFENTTAAVQTLSGAHFREANYQNTVELPADRVITAARIPRAVAQDASSIGWCPLL